MSNPGADESTETMYPGAPNDRPGWHVRLFGSRDFFRLWLVQVVSAIGDWLGLLATTYFAQDLFPSDPNAAAAAISLVISVRLLPHLFLAPVAGVIVDRFDRKKVMVVCDLARAGVLVALPFAKNLPALIAASLLLEIFTLQWTPAKEAVTPHLVPHDHLTTANSLNLAAGYGTAPIATLVFTALAGLSAWLGSFAALSFLGLNQTALAFYADALTFLFSAFMIWRLPIPGRRRAHAPAAPKPDGSRKKRVDMRQAVNDLKEGWHYIFINRTVRAVNLSLGIALIGGGMLIPLGAVFSTEVLGAGAAGYGLFTTALMFGVALGVVGVSLLQKRLPKEPVFAWALFVAGSALLIGASVGSLGAAAALVFVMGASVGPTYVLGFSILHEQVDDDLRGRVFAALNTLVRFCVFVALVAGPLIAAGLDGLSNRLTERTVDFGGLTYFIPGVRLTLWFDALIILAAGSMAHHSIKLSQREQAESVRKHPANGRGDQSADSGDAPVVPQWPR